MAARPWVTPKEVKAYTDHEEVAKRDEEKLKLDIARAELKVIGITNNSFLDKEYPVIPEAVRLAVVLAADAYAKNAVEKARKQIKSETFDDYSYTVGTAEVDLASLGLEELLEAFIVAPERGNTVMRLRRL